MEAFGELKGPVEWVVGSDRKRAGVDTGLQIVVMEIVTKYQDGASTE